ncbi:MAG: DUF2271 domain-containing protein [Clostridiales Family XIII bacterium]|jgi:hypothetical protein|nr:DUF2271 domain-containing protein [Clostridiales Family XIII bacterium]
MRRIGELIILQLIVLLALTSCAAPAAPPADTVAPPADTVAPESGAVTIDFDFQKQSGHASNQFAVWIEDADGRFVKTLYATKFTAAGGYKNRPDSIPEWTARSGLADMTDVDAITGATPQSGALKYTWDLTDADNVPVPDGTYMFFVEGSLRWKNSVMYIGEIEIGGEAASATADEGLIFEASEDQPALNNSSAELGMIGPVTASYTPPS